MTGAENVQPRAWGRLTSGLVGAIVFGGLAGCSGGDGPLATGSILALPSSALTVPGKPVDVYVKLARLAKSCWFTPPAPLQQGYVFTAEVSPEHQGGAASIAIFERNATADRASEGERGLKAFAVALTPAGEGTTIGFDTGRLAAPLDRSMRHDIERWAGGETACGEAVAWQTTAAAGDAVPKVKPVKATAITPK